MANQLYYSDGTQWIPVATGDGPGGPGGTGTHREVLMATGVTPPEPLISSDNTDWLYGEA